ncbi:hypothetical protein EW026_g4108 [Hermanssonia centrifuga]|uniref:DUF6533 domain-containing protein n=1 Tax=Hermanssonia centrifuga TaxID=98765 RepID=A0A4S4KJD0_9APHY|nr:hypothetical protein EW026_g4108 [Hermanssonia centrifuga]
MSQTNSETLTQFQADLTHALILWAMGALAAYEYAITIRQEVTMVWLRKWTISTWLFLVNRYLMIILVILGLLPVVAKVRSYIIIRRGCSVQFMPRDVQVRK